MTTKEYIEKHKKYPGTNHRYFGWRRDLKQIKEFNKSLTERYPWLIPINNWSGKRITDCIGSDGEEGFWPGSPDKHPDYDYEYTSLDNMPDGWRIAFGDQMIEEIHQELIKYNFVDKYQIVQIKEKYGGLRWYDNGTPIGRLSEDYKTFTRKGTETLKADWDTKKYCMREDYSEHYISFFDKEKVRMTKEEIEEYNKDAIHHYRLYKILEKCTIPEIIRKYEELSYKTCIVCGEPAKWESKGWISPYCTDCANKLLNDEFEHFKRVSKDPEKISRGTLERDFTRI